MSFYKRPQFAEIRQRLNEKPERMLIIRGPRQCGKTTLIKQVLEDVRLPWQYVSTENPTESSRYPENSRVNSENNCSAVQQQITDVNTNWLVEKWLTARKQANSSKRGAVLVIDEIQRLANWSETVKGLWDSDKFYGRLVHVVLLGSSPLLMRKGMSENLTGRFEIIRLSHWSYEEMSEAFGFSLEQFVFYGGYPSAAPLIENDQHWKKYVRGLIVETVIERDVLEMQRIDKPVLLRQYLETCATYSGQVVSYNKILGQLQNGGNTTTLTNYLSLIQEVGLIAGIPKYTIGEIRRRASSPKLNVLNSAIISAFSNYTFEEARLDRSHWRRLEENAVGAHLLNTDEGLIQFFYWRQNNKDVEFVLRLGHKIITIVVEGVKQQGDLHGVNEFCERYDVLRNIVVSPNAIPLSEFLSYPVEHWFAR